MYQKIVIVGNLGADPEMRYTPQGDAVTSFNVATNRKWNQDGQPMEQVTWFRVSAWGRQAESCNQYLKKGSKVLVEGRLAPDRDTGGARVWTDNNGNSRASYELRALQVQFLGTSGGGHNPPDDWEQTGGEPVESAPIDEDEIPF